MSDTNHIARLSEEMFELARRMLKQQRQFYPFGAVATGADIEIVSGDLGHPWSDSDELATLLWEQLAERAGSEVDVDAVAVAVDTGKLIAVEVHHRDVKPMVLTQSYKKAVIGKRVDFEEVTITAAEARPSFWR